MTNQLTPEEQRRIYLEESVRLAARDHYEAEKARRRWRIILGILLLPVIIFCLLVVVQSVLGPSPKDRATKQTIQQEEQKIDQALDRLKQTGRQQSQGRPQTD